MTQCPDGTPPADAARQVADELGLTDRDPTSATTDVRISVYPTMRAQVAEHTHTIPGFCSPPPGPGAPAGTELGDLAGFVDWLTASEGQILAVAGCPRGVVKRFSAAWLAEVAPALPHLVVPVRSAGTPTAVPAGGPHLMIVEAGTVGRYGDRPYRPDRTGGGSASGAPDTGTTGAAGTPGAGTPASPPPDRTGTTERPAVWTRDAPTPGPQVVRIFDGITYYTRTPADRWVPEGHSGPGFAWTQIPAALRVDASRPYHPAADGALALATLEDKPS